MMFSAKMSHYGMFLLNLVLLALVLPRCLGFSLDGSAGSYAKFPGWEPCLNGTLSFEFQTDRPNALLFYFDSGQKKYLELKLVGGIAKLKVNFGKGLVILSAGSNLNDNAWHKVEIIRNNLDTTLLVDSIEFRRKSLGVDFDSENVTEDRFLFMGGLPEEYDRELSKLSLPSVLFEPKFRGSIRNVFYSNCGALPERPEMIDSQGILDNEADLCEQGNPCLNSGSCLTTDHGLVCDCTRTEFQGERCEIEKIPSDATFLGAQYFSYELISRGDPIVSNSDELKLDFRTKQVNGILFFTGDLKDYLNVAVRDGGIIVTINLGSGAYEAEVRPSHVRFDDGRWHHLVVRREAREISVEVDGVHRKSGSTTGQFTLLSSSLLYVGGSPNTATLVGSRVTQNFKGCMRKVRYKADTIDLDLTELAKTDHGLITVHGGVIFNKCQELVESHPITFATPNSFLTLPTWDVRDRRGSIAFQFQTTEPSGVIMFNPGPDGHADFFAVEMLDGHLYMIVDLGEGSKKVKASRHPVSDGNPHEVYIDYQGPQGYITLDGQKESYYTDGKDVDLNLSGIFFLGGISKKHDTSKLPHSMWAGMLRHGFVGCLQDLVVNGNKVDLVATARAQRAQGIAEYCHRMEPQCASHPCMHRGQCLEGWNRFVCDCRSTGFNGDVCQTAATSLRFDGTQYVKVKFPEESSTEAEDISMRFRTMHPNGLLFMTTSDKTSDRMELYLEAGALELRVDVGSGTKELTVGSVLNDDRWHTVVIKRRAQTIELGIDSHRPVTDQLPGQETSLDSNVIYIGSLEPLAAADMGGRVEDLDFRGIKIGHMMLDDNSLGDYSGFIGSMQQFLFNKNAFFELAKIGDIENIVVTARFSTDDYVVRDPVTFKSASAFATLNQLQAYEDFSLSFQFKTTEAYGLLFYNSGRGQDFFAIEMSEGYLYYVYNMGDGSERIRANSKSVLNDNKWHEVKLLRPQTYKQLIRVDDNTPTVDNLQGAHAVNFNLEGHLYVGGVRKTMYHSLPKNIKSRHGFLGCLGSLDLNSYLPQLVKEADTIHESVVEGCKGPTTQCQADSCNNYGRCVQQWNSYNCDCDMTSFEGTTCNEKSTSYEFGPNGGMVILSHPQGKHPNAIRDNLALGFTTRSKDAVLARINSGNYDDYLELELVNGNVFVVYNMGTSDHPIGELFERVNDGKYHIVRFTRNGANSTIQVDNAMMQTKNPRGAQLEVFNDQAEVLIGGKRDKDGNLIKPFEGTISGLVLNSMRILDLAKEGDSRINIQGDVRLKEEESGKKSETHKNRNTIPDESEMQSTMGFRLTENGEPWTKYSQVTTPLPSDSKAHKKRSIMDNWEMVNTNKLRHSQRKHKRRDRNLYNRQFRLLVLGDRDPDDNSMKRDWEVGKSRNQRTHGRKGTTPDWRQDDQIASNVPQRVSSEEGTCHFEAGGSFVDMEGHRFQEGSGGDTPEIDPEDYSDYDTSTEIITTLLMSDPPSTTPDEPEEEPDTSSVTKVLVFKPKDNEVHTPLSKNRTEETSRHFVWTNRMAGLLSTIGPTSTFMQTTPKLGVTDDIIFSGAGPGCHSDDEDDCTSVGSGTEDDIITPTIIIKTTPAPPTTTTKKPTWKPPCVGSKCPRTEEVMSSTSNRGTSLDPEGNDGSNTGLHPTGETSGGSVANNGGGTPVNIGLIIGIAAGVLVAILILIFALYKFRSRDEGTYKVDESQNFSYLESKKQQGNGALLGKGEETGKRGKKKDVKEWYV
ncbi:neurexin-1-like isoform X2 [Haliotis rufescens]|uniref:neurexin-1-like isoform X2 n=1 Tax=Haliotis rufescens TaxID=6454 RepID=UPI00201FA373|nr:neurexin-1-like isoform X2 [Haliotis rufescens]